MSVYEQVVPVNSTLIEYEVNQSLLTPGQIALITILSTFVFYITIMFIVCVGEYCQYTKGKKKRPEIRRRHHSATNATGIHSNDPIPRSLLSTDVTSGQSEFMTKPSVSQSDNRNVSDKHCRFSNITESASHASMNRNTSEIQLVNDGIVEVYSENSLNHVSIDCTDRCETPYLKLEQDIVMLPLISKQCDDALDIDGEIFCDSSDSKDMYKLEADV